MYVLYWYVFQSKVAFCVENIIYKLVELDALFSTCQFLNELQSAYFTIFEEKMRLKLCLHKYDFLTPYFAYILTSKVLILVNHSNYTS